MTIRLSDNIQEGSTTGFNVTIYDSSSAAIIPNSLDWYLYDSFGDSISSGSPSALSSQSLIVLGSSLTLTVSGETRSNIKRILDIYATYNDSSLGNNAIERETFEFTLVNNPAL